MLIALLVGSLLMAIFAPVIIPIITPGFDDVNTELTIQLTRIMLLSPVLLALGSVASSILNTEGRFAAAAFAPMFYNGLIIICALALAPFMGIDALAVGVVVGSFAHLMVQLPSLRRRFHYDLSLDLRDPRHPPGTLPDGAARHRAGRQPGHVHRQHDARDRSRGRRGGGLQHRLQRPPDPDRRDRRAARRDPAAGDVARRRREQPAEFGALLASSLRMLAVRHVLARGRRHRAAARRSCCCSSAGLRRALRAPRPRRRCSSSCSACRRTA